MSVCSAVEKTTFMINFYYIRNKHINWANIDSLHEKRYGIVFDNQSHCWPKISVNLLFFFFKFGSEIALRFPTKMVLAASLLNSSSNFIYIINVFKLQFLPELCGLLLKVFYPVTWCPRLLFATTTGHPYTLCEPNSLFVSFIKQRCWKVEGVWGCRSNGEGLGSAQKKDVSNPISF